MKYKNIILTLAILLILPLVTAVSISNTNLSSPDANNSVSVDSVTLTKLIINSTSIELYNVSSEGTEFINVNATYNASLYFYGLIVDLGVFNVNESFYLFNSTAGNQDYSATFQPKYILRIISFALDELVTMYGKLRIVPLINNRTSIKIMDLIITNEKSGEMIIIPI